jgi:hypothetical protein
LKDYEVTVIVKTVYKLTVTSYDEKDALDEAVRMIAYDPHVGESEVIGWEKRQIKELNAQNDQGD